MSNLVKVNQFDVLPERLKNYAIVRVGKKPIKELHQSEIKRACAEIYALAHSEFTGELSIDNKILIAQTEFLFNELNGKFKDLTLDELRECFKMGVREEFGKFYGLCAKTYNQFIKGYFERPERAEAMRVYLDSIKGEIVKEKPTPEQQHEIMLNGVRSALEDYKSEKKLPYSPAPYYDFLWQDLKLINWTLEEKEEIKKEASKIYESKIKQKKIERIITTQQAKDLLSNISSNQSYINTLKSVGLKRFFEVCILTNHKL